MGLRALGTAASAISPPGRLDPLMVDADPVDTDSVDPDPSVVTVTTMVSADSTRPRTIPIGVTDVDLVTMRRAVGLTGVGLALLTLLVVATRAIRSRRRSEADRLLDRHRRRVLPLAEWNQHLERYAVEVADFEALEAISAASQLPILYVCQDEIGVVADPGGYDIHGSESRGPDTSSSDDGDTGIGRSESRDRDNGVFDNRGTYSNPSGSRDADIADPEARGLDDGRLVTRFVVIDGSTSFVYRASGGVGRSPHHRDRHTEHDEPMACAP